MILLTEVEIVAEASKDKEYCQLSVDVGMWAAREQLKKIVEWGIERCQEHYKGGGVISKRECPECWRTLKKEVGG